MDPALTTARAACFCLAALLAAGGGTRALAKEPDPDLPKLEVPFVTIVTDSLRVRGCPLPSDPETARTLLRVAAESGHVATMQSAAVQKVIPEDPQNVVEVSSQALVEGLGLEDRTAQEYCEALLEQQEARASEALLAGLGNASPEVRWRCLKLLELIPARENAGRIRGLLRDPVPRVRRHALSAYLAADPGERLSVCESFFTFESDPLVLHEAVVQIGSCKDPHAVDALLDLLSRTEERSVEIQVYAALRRLTRQSFGRNESGWRAWWTNHRGEWIEAQ